MDDPRIVELEASIADLGTLLLQVERYRAADGPPGEALRARALGLGYRARRLGRSGALTGPELAALVADTRTLQGELAALRAAVRGGADYREATRAHAARDAAALERLLPRVFAGIAVRRPPAHLYYRTVSWRRRGRAQSPDALATAARTTSDAGLAAEEDDLAPGIDPALPGIVLAGAPPDDEPLALVVAPPAGIAVLHRTELGDWVAYEHHLPGPFPVFVRHTLDPGAALDVDYAAYRAALLRGLARAGLRIAHPSQ